MTQFVSPSRTLPLVLAILLFCVGTLCADDHTPADRLLDAELIELTEGRVDEALAVYQSILADEELTPSVRARTLFALARAQRKLGELGAARKSYRELIDRHADEANLVKAAHRYLAEINDSARSLPEFNWVEQVERNPEIQAQIFEWGMQLVHKYPGSGPEVHSAWHKLLALGTVVIPVLEPMLKETTGSVHKRNLSEILIRLGEWQHLPTLIEGYPDSYPRHLLRYLQRLDSSERSEALEQVLAITETGTWNEFRMSARLTLENFDELEVILRDPKFDDWETIKPLLADPAIARRVRVVFEETSERNLPRYAKWISSLIDSPFVLESDWNVFLEDVSGRIGDVQLSTLMKRLGPKNPVLHRFLASPNHRRLLNSAEIRERHIQNIGWDPSVVPPGLQAQITYQQRYLAELLRQSLANEEAIPWLIQDLVERETGFRSALSSIRPLTKKIQPRGRRPIKVLGPAAIRLTAAVQRAFTESYSTLGDGGKAFVVQLMTMTANSLTEESKAFLSSLLDDEELDPVFRVLGVIAQLETTDQVTSELAKRLLPILVQAESELSESRFITMVRPLHRSVISDVFPPDRELWAEIRLEVGLFHGDILLQADEQAMRGTHERFGSSLWRLCSPTRFPAGIAKLFAKNPTKDSIRLLHRLLGSANGRLSPDTFDQRLAFLREVGPSVEPAFLRLVYNGLGEFRLADAPPLGPWILDQEIDISVRFSSIQRFDQDESALETVDWLALFLSDDPLLERLSKPSTELARILDPHLGALRRAPTTTVRSWAWRRSTKLTLGELAAGLDDPASSIRAAAAAKILASEHVEVLPLLHRLMKEEGSEHRSAAIARVTAFAEEASVRPLRELLSDPILSTRTAALEALKEIDRIRKDRGRWQIPDRSRRKSQPVKDDR